MCDPQTLILRRNEKVVDLYTNRFGNERSPLSGVDQRRLTTTNETTKQLYTKMSQSSKKTGAQTIDTSKLDQSSKTQTDLTQHSAPSSAGSAKPNVRPSRILEQVAEKRAAYGAPGGGDLASREQEIESISPIKPAAKASHPLPSPAQINAYAISQLTDRPLRRGGKLYDGRLPEKYKPAARR